MLRGGILLACALLSSCAPRSGPQPQPRPRPGSAAPLAVPAADAARQVDASPAGRVAAFLEDYRRLVSTGLPDLEQQQALAPHWSARLRGLMRDAHRGQAAYIAKYPTDKPPLVEGDLFSSLFEGPTAFRIDASSVRGGTATVRVAYTYTDARDGDVSRWTDRFILTKDDAGPGWVIDDLAYDGGWDFAPKGRLGATLAATAALP